MNAVHAVLQNEWGMLEGPKLNSSSLKVEQGRGRHAERPLALYSDGLSISSEVAVCELLSLVH